MKTVNIFLKEARLAAGFSLQEVEKETRIKASFIDAIEKADWKVLPEFPVVLGFVKNIAGFLGIDRNQAAALFKRDYPPQKISFIPPADFKEGFHWGPRLTFGVSVVFVILAVFSYLIFQYVDFVKNPTLIVIDPKDGAEVTVNSLVVSGKTDPDVNIRVNNQPVTVSENGDFSTELLITSETDEILIKAVSRSGKETEVKRQIKPRLPGSD
jgi:cytoskeletal protein RodZ